MPDAPTPDPSPAEVMALSLEEWHDEWAGEPFTYTFLSAMQVAALDAAGYEIVRKGSMVIPPYDAEPLDWEAPDA